MVCLIKSIIKIFKWKKNKVQTGYRIANKNKINGGIDFGFFKIIKILRLHVKFY